jgi:hypothetical protein
MTKLAKVIQGDKDRDTAELAKVIQGDKYRDTPEPDKLRAQVKTKLTVTPTAT